MLPKRTVSEIIFIAQTEQSLVDVYCEGPLDARVILSFARSTGHANTLVYPAELIEWPEDAATFNGHRGKVVYLSNKFTAMKLQGACVIDQDLDTIQNSSPENGNLLKTDFSCMEMYGLAEDDLSAYLSATYNVSISASTFSTIFAAIKLLFVIRFLRDKYCMGASLPPPVEIIAGTPDKLEIARDAYLDRCSQVNGYDNRWDKLRAAIQPELDSLGTEKRNYMNIHDLSAVLAKVIRLRKSKTVQLDPFFLERHCAYLIISRSLYSHPMFDRLTSAISATEAK